MRKSVEPTIYITSPEAKTTVGTAENGGTAMAQRVAEFVDGVADAVASGELQGVNVPVGEIRADVQAIQSDGLVATLERLRSIDQAEHPELFDQAE